MYVGGNSALKGFLLVRQLVKLKKQIYFFDKLWEKLKKLAMTLHTVAE